MNVSQLSATGKKHLPLIELDDQEEILYEIRKHPIGLAGIYLLGLLVAAAVFSISLAATYYLDNDGLGVGTNLDFLKSIITVVGGLMAIFALVMTAIGAYLYQSNVVYVTSEKIAQVLYRTIFDRKISQLSIGDVQDVTTNQRGILARFFNYGTLVIETAGEQANYTFTLTPNPYEASKSIVNAHEENLKKYGN